MFDAILALMFLCAIAVPVIYFLAKVIIGYRTWLRQIVLGCMSVMLSVLVVSATYFTYPEMGDVGIGVGVSFCMLYLFILDAVFRPQ